MRRVEHLSELLPCPFLPDALEPVTAASMKVHGKNRGSDFYLGALTCAQSLWLQGLPAQAMLQLSRAFGADLDGSEDVLKEWPLPYRAMMWVMSERQDEHFIGNPRRHFQHLATRMVEPRKDVRTWRAWACWHLACLVFPNYPADEIQIAEEGVIEPALDEITKKLSSLGNPGEAELWESVWK